MMRIRPALGEAFSVGMLRRGTVATSETANSDMDGLLGGCRYRCRCRYQRKIQGEGCAFAWAALHADVASVFLDDAVSDGKAKTGAATLAFGRRVLGREEGIVDALNVFLGDAGAGVRDANTDKFSVQRGYSQHAAAGGGHGVLGVQKQIQKHLLQASSVALNQWKIVVEFRLHFDVGHLELVLEQGQRIADYLIQIEF